MVPVAAGIYAVCQGTIPWKPKYAVCAIPSERLFFLFNSKAYRPGSLGLLEVTVQEAGFLRYKSFLDTGLLISFEPKALRDCMAAGHVWPTAPELRQRIKDAVAFHKMIPRMYEQVILATF
jgi:hypothetical protein